MSARESRTARTPSRSGNRPAGPFPTPVSWRGAWRVVLFCLLAGLLAGVAGAQVGIGVAKDESVSGRIVTLDFVIENFAADTLSDVSLVDDLDATFGAGNYTILSGPTVASEETTILANAGYDGSGDTEMIASGTLAVGEVVEIELIVEIEAVVDQGLGLGFYANQATGSAVIGVGMLSLGGGFSTDLSDDGTDPDPDGNGDPGDAGEDDPTLIDLFANPILGAAKTATLAGTQVTFDFYLENFGNRTMVSLSLPDDLDAVFGSGNYSIVTPPVFVDDPGTLTLNAGFDGSGSRELIASGILVVGDTARIRVVVNVDTVTDQGAGFGVYQNQVTFSGTTSTGAPFSDLSDAGIDPDPSGDGQPRDEDEEDPTVFVIGQEPAIGVAKAATVNGTVVTLDFFLANLGNEDLEEIVLADDLDAVFGAGNYTVTVPPTVVAGAMTVVPDETFDGEESQALVLAESTLAAGATSQVQVVVRVDALADVGLGLGVYRNQVSVVAEGMSGGVTGDVSDSGTDPDSNGNGDPTEAGENDATNFAVGEVPLLGLAKQVRVLPGSTASIDVGGTPQINFGPRVVVTLTLENLGNVTVDSISVEDDLIAVFGNGNFGTIISNQFPEVTLAGAGSLSRENTYNGSTNQVVISSGSLAPGSVATIVFELLVIDVTDVGDGLGVYENQASVSGLGPSSGMTTDLSGPGDLADPDQNGDPTNDGEDDPTPFIIGSSIGVAKTASVSGSTVTFDLYLEVFGPADLTELSLIDDLDAVFGAGRFTLSSAPVFIDNPDTVLLDPSYDGTTANSELLAPGSYLAQGDTAQIRFEATVFELVNRGNGLGVYSNQAIATGTQPGGLEVFDLSDSGTEPDPNEDGDPSGFGEADPTLFTIAADAVVGVAKDVSIAGNQVTFDFFLENFGSATSNGLSLTDDLDLTFGVGNYAISSGPSLIVDPGTLVLDGSFDGSTEQDLLAAGSTLAAGAVAQIRIVVDITTVADVGLGLGTYSNQARVTGTDSTGLVISDLSDFGTDPDPSGDGDPTAPGLADPPVDGENDPTEFFLGNLGLGVALHSYVDGSFITYDYYFENLGDVTISSISGNQSLLGAFGFGNYTVTQPLALIEGDGSLVPNVGFDGTFATGLAFNGVLDPGETARFRFVIEVTNGANGPDYTTQFTAVGIDPLDNGVSDTSDDGIDPDPDGDGNANEAGENDATSSILGVETSIGVAKNVSVLGTMVTFDLYLENLGNGIATALSLEEDLDAVFGAGNYIVTGAPSLIDNPGTLILEPTWSGSANVELLAAGSTLVAGDTAQIRIELDVTTITDQGLGLGSYRNQVTFLGTGAMDTVGADVSDAGTDPDLNGNGNPADAGESDPSFFDVSEPVVGVAKAATVDGDLVTLDYVVENLGNETLQGYSMPEDLDAVFGAGSYQLISGPVQVGTVRNLVVNESFDGSTNTDLFAGGSQGVGFAEQFRVVVRILRVTDQGSGAGVYSNQVTVTAQNAGGFMVSDLSDNGLEPDPNGNDLPDDAGEDDPTPIVVAENPVVGVAKEVSVVSRSVTVDLFLESFGNVPATALVVGDDLDSVFGAGTFTLTSPPVLVVDPGTLNLNPAFGPGNDDLLLAGSSLAQGAVAQIRFEVEVTTPTDQGFGFGVYQNQVRAAATGPFGAVVQDLSDAGTDPDPDGDGNPGGVGEADPTPIALRGSIGDLVWNDVDGDGARDAGELGIDDVVVYLDLDGNGVLDGGEPSDTTAGGGLYGFVDLAAGNYDVRVDPAGLPTGFVLTTGNDPEMVPLLAGENFEDADFGYRASATLSISKADDPDPVTAGESLTYSLEVTNAGPGDAPGGVVFDLLPAGTTLDSDTGGCVENSDLDALRAMLTPDAEVPPVVSSASGSATFVLDTTTQVLYYALHVAEIDNITMAHIHAGAAGVNGPVVQFLYDGSPLFDPANPISGTIQLTAMEASDLLSGDFYVNVHTSDFPGGEIRGQIAAAAGTLLACDLGALAATESSAFEITVDVDSDVAAGSVLGNVASVFGNVDDPTGVDLPAPNGTGRIRGDTVLAETTVETSADLSLTKVDAADPVAAGTGITYTLEVSNAGPSDAASVVLTDTLPAGLTFVSTSGCAEDPGGVPTCSLGDLVAGSSTMVTIEVTADAGTVGTVTNMASVTSDTSDPDMADNSASEDTTIEAVADLSITKVDSVDPALAGTSLTYTLEVTNNGPSDATSVVVTDTLPAGVTFVSTSGCTEDPNGVPTCSLGTLLAGGSASYTVVVDIDSDTLGTLTNSASVASAATDPVTANDSVSEDTLIEAEADLSITKVDSVDPVIAGTGLTYTLEVTNAGPSDAASVVITETLPAGVTLVSTTGCTEDPSGIPTCSLGDLVAGGSTSVTVEVTVDSDTLGVLSNTASVTSATTDPDEAANTATEETVVEARADLSITKIDSQDPVVAGTDFVYTVEVTNNGPSDAASVVVTDTLPGGVTFVSTTGCAEDPGGVPTCSLGDLANGEMASFTIAVTADADTVGVVTNTAVVSSATADPVAANDTATEDTTIAAESDLAITKTDSVDPVPPGATLVYTLEVTNAGPSEATGVVITETLPAGVTLVSTSGCAEDPNGVPTCTLGDLAVDGMATVTVEVTVDGDTPSGTVTNTASVASDGMDPDSDNNSDSEDTLVDADAPTVVGVGSQADTGDGEVEECEEVRTGVSQLLLTFSEPLNDPPGDDDADDVTNPDNYRLVAAGPNRDLETLVCAPPPLGDDVSITIDAVAYDAETDTATLSLAGGQLLEDEVYRLLACGSTSLQDIAGNPLDGDADGTGGDDFLRTFRVERSNLLRNGHFDCSIEEWVAVATIPEEIEYSSEDFDDASISGSAEITNLSASQDFSLGQCVEVPGNLTCSLDLRLQVEAAADILLTATRVCESFSGPACTGLPLGVDASTAFVEDSGGEWLEQQLVTALPAGTTSVLCSVDLRTEDGADFNAFVDEAFLTCRADILFADGFESGDTSAWTSTSP